MQFSPLCISVENRVVVAAKYKNSSISGNSPTRGMKIILLVREAQITQKTYLILERACNLRISECSMMLAPSWRTP